MQEDTVSSNLILDTNVLLTDPKAFQSYPSSNIFITFTILEELDKAKKFTDQKGFNAREVIRFLDSMNLTSAANGVDIGDGTRLFLINTNHEKTGDNAIIADMAAIHYSGYRNVKLVSMDLNIRLKAKLRGYDSQDHVSERQIQSETLFGGIREIYVDDNEIDMFYLGSPLVLPPEDAEGLNANDFVVLKSYLNSKKTAIARFMQHGYSLQRVRKDFTSLKNFGYQPRNLEQILACDLLLDPDVKLVTLIGKSGSGKTLAAMATGLAQIGVLPGQKKTTERLYDKLVICRPIVPVGRDLGYLPGAESEK